MKLEDPRAPPTTVEEGMKPKDLRVFHVRDRSISESGMNPEDLWAPPTIVEDGNETRGPAGPANHIRRGNETLGPVGPAALEIEGSHR